MKKIEEIMNNITAFERMSYRQDELLPELLKLQEQMVKLTFSDERAENSNLKLWDIKDYLTKLNEIKGGVADTELADFARKSGAVCNLISGEITGRNGEKKVFRALDIAHTKPKVLQNVEFFSEGIRTEIDAIAVTNKAVFIIEVKNTSNNIHIDEKGNYFLAKPDYDIYDCNILEKINIREYLVKKCMENAGIENVRIVNFIVFTNSSMDVNNECEYLNYAYLSQLNHKIDDYEGMATYTESDIRKIVEFIEKERTTEEYEPEVNMTDFKHSFAALIVALDGPKEDADKKTQTADTKLYERKHMKKRNRSILREVMIPCAAIIMTGGLASTLFIKSRQ